MVGSRIPDSEEWGYGALSRADGGGWTNWRRFWESEKGTNQAGFSLKRKLGN